MITDILMAETCAITGAMASILAGLALAENPSIKRAFIFGCVGGLAALCRAELVLYLPLITLIIFKSEISFKTKLTQCASVAIAALLVVMPWVARNLNSFEKQFYRMELGQFWFVPTDSTYFGPNSVTGN